MGRESRWHLTKSYLESITMKIDFATLAFGYSIISGGGTPNWATSLGQSREKEYRINDDPEITSLIKGITYKSVSLSTVATKIGKGGALRQGNSPDSPVILAGLFEKVFVNTTQIIGGKYLILITRDTSDSHFGRLRFKYGPSNSYSSPAGLNYSNQTFWDTAKKQLGLKSDACFFVYDISVVNQDELYLNTVIVNPNGPQRYKDNADHHSAWDPLIPHNGNKQGSKGLTQSYYKSFALNSKQVIYYGVPGCGKSNKIDEVTAGKVENDFQKKRVVFHPDYTNADFEGQILPGVADGNIRYEFKPGPFTKILKRAYENPEKPFYLVIEEINRGNAAAIFGDIFQLLDRLTDDENNNIGGNTYTKGWSKYFIENDFINAYLRNKKEYSDSAYKDNDTESAKTFFQNITFTSNTGIRLPPNLSLLATMNTSDQNVFALDNAFQRRWDLRLVPNEIPENSLQYNAEIENTGIKWGKFMDWANRKISESNNFAGTGSMEDRCLGAYFVIHDGRGKIQSKTFAEKVIKYLWDDVFRMERESFFIMEKGESFGSITKRFYKNHSLQEIFKDFEIPENAEYKKESLGYVT